jgi:hypothetical protein
VTAPPRVVDRGVAVYVGAPRTGKTTRALADARAAGRALGWPVLVLDLAGAVGRPPGFQRAANARAVLLRLLREREAVVWCPDDMDEATALLRALLAARPARVVLLVDEWSFLFGHTGHAGAPVRPLVALCRTWRHAQVRVLATTQHLSGDIPAAIWSCAPAWYVHRTTGPHSLQAAVRLGIDPEAVRGLPEFSCVEA